MQGKKNVIHNYRHMSELLVTYYLFWKSFERKSRFWDINYSSQINPHTVWYK